MFFDPMAPLPILFGVVLLFGAFIGLTAFRAPKGRRLLPVIRRSLIVVALLAVALRPGVAGLGERVTVATGVDVIIVMDTTGSMVAEDWGGTPDEPAEPRIVGMREDAAAILEEFAGARFSLLTFDAAAVIRVPLTTDATAVQSAIDVIEPEVTSYSSGSSISIANELLLRTLLENQEAHPERQRVVFYLGDGEQTDGSAPASFAESEPLVTGGGVFGYGTEAGGRMEENSGPFRGDDEEARYIQDRATGEEARSVIDEANLRAVSAELGVDYFHRVAGEALPVTAADVPGQPDTVETQVRTVVELYWIAGLAAFVLFLWEAAGIAMALADLRRPRGSTL